MEVGTYRGLLGLEADAISAMTAAMKGKKMSKAEKVAFKANASRVRHPKYSPPASRRPQPPRA